jgi:hypothetical protein
MFRVFVRTLGLVLEVPLHLQLFVNFNACQLNYSLGLIKLSSSSSFDGNAIAIAFSLEFMF